MRRVIIFLCIILISGISIHSLEVDEQELKSIDAKIEFNNYKGKRTIFQTSQEVRSIGYYLAERLEQENEWVKYHLKYSVIHAVGEEEEGKLDADIISIDKNALVDHVRNIQRIIAGYLEREYAYSFNDSNLLALFICYYNAFYHKNIEYFSQRYKDVVIKHLSEDNAGLSVNYFEWAGQARIIIPLTAKAGEGNISSLDTTALTEDDVVEEIRKKDDMGLEERKEMIDLKEREVEAQQEEIKEEKEALEQEQEQVAESEKLLIEQKKELDEKKQEIEENGGTPEQIAEIEEQKQEIQQQEAEISQDKVAIAEKEAEIQQQEEKIAVKQEEIEKERAEIVSDERSQDTPAAVAQTETSQTTGGESRVYYLNAMEFVPEGYLQSNLVLIDPQAGIISSDSRVKIYGKIIEIMNSNLLVIGQADQAVSTGKLILLNPDSLAVTAQSQQSVFKRSFMKIFKNEIYVIIEDSGGYYLAKFDSALNLKAKSSEQVDKDSFFYSYDNKVYVNSTDKKIIVLSESDLALISAIESQ